MPVFFLARRSFRRLLEVATALPFKRGLHTMTPIDYTKRLALQAAQAKRSGDIAQGESGEQYVRELLFKFFTEVRPESSLRARSPDGGVDVEARCVIRDLDVRQPTFHFQVKTLAPDGRFVVSRDNFVEYCRLLDEDEPVVFILIMRGQDLQIQEVKFLCWREWVLAHGSSHKAFTAEARNSIDLTHDFMTVGNDLSVLKQSLSEELEHARKGSKALFRTHEASFALPIKLGFLVTNLEHADRIWFPKEIIEELPIDVGAHELTAQFVNAWQGDPTSLSAMRTFTANLQANDKPQEPKRFARDQFGLFIDAMKKFANGHSVTLPPFNARTMACWRTFAAYFPHSLRLFEHLAKHGTRHNDRVFSLVMLPIFVITAGEKATSRSDRVVTTLLDIVEASGTVSSFEAYRLVREAHRSLLETGRATKPDENKFIDLLHQHRRDPWELQHLHHYGGGWEGTGALQKLEEKLNHGTLRDMGARPFYLWAQDAFPKMLRHFSPPLTGQR
jgi:hypothetical protein